MARKIVVTSGKGGVGKTTLTANLGLALAKKSLRVCLIDLDIGLNNLDVVMGIEDKVLFDFIDVVEGRCRATQALVPCSDEPTLYTMPSCHRAKIQISAEAVKRVLSRLEDLFDYVLVDCPAGIDSGFRRAISGCTEAIVVVTPHLATVRDVAKTIDALDDMLGISVVVNRVRGDLVSAGEMLTPSEVFGLLGCNPLGIIPDNDKVNCYGTFDFLPFDILADNLHNGEKVMYDCEQNYRGLFGRLKRNLKRSV